MHWSSFGSVARIFGNFPVYVNGLLTDCMQGGGVCFGTVIVEGGDRVEAWEVVQVWCVVVYVC